MERKRLEKEAVTPPPQARRETWMPAGTSPPATGSDVLKRYGLALVLAGLALLVRALLPVPQGASIYQLPIAAVVLSAWYGGRGPACSHLSSAQREAFTCSSLLGIRSSCRRPMAPFLHLHRSVPVAQRVQCGAQARRG